MADGNRNRDSPSDKLLPRKDDGSSTDNKGKQSDSSMASRIQDSASGLARNAFFTPGPPRDLAHTLASGGKAGPSSSASFERSSSQAVADQYRQSSASSSTQGHGGGAPSETFRSSAPTQQGFDLPPFSEEEFQHTYDGNIGSSFRHDTELGKGKERVGDSEFITPSGSQVPLGFDAAWQKGSHDAINNTTSQHPSDGAAVVSLLTDRSFDPEFPISAHEPAEPVDTELSQQSLTQDEIQMIETFRRQLPPPEQPQPSRINPASLIPDIDTFLNGVTPGPGTEATALRDNVLTNLPGAADWIAVEERYHDEVWGYLRPTLEAAAKEMEDNKDSQTAEDGPAVRRLKMVLTHMQR